MLVLYHAGLTQASVKVRLTLKEKALHYESRFVRLFEQDHLSPDYLAINPDGQVPTLVHDGEVITETTIINEYIDEVFPDPPLRPDRPAARARMRRWGQMVDEHLFHAVATLAWHYGIGPILREKDPADIDRALARLPVPSKRQKWLKASRTGFAVQELDDARNKIAYGIAQLERALATQRYLVEDSYSLADINVFSSVQRMPRWAPDLMSESVSPRTYAWLQAMKARPAVQATLSVSDEAPPLPPDVWSMRTSASVFPAQSVSPVVARSC
jgi:glutathione S-transferase